MNEEKFWDGYGRMMKLLEALGLVLLVFGPIIGIVLLFMQDMGVRFVGVFLIVMSAFLSLYHFSFAYVMHALRQACQGRMEPEPEQK